MRAHTPGPWKVEDDGHLDHEGKLWVVDERGLCVAELESYDEAVITPTEAEYNAGLISAAPELLALVKQYRKETLEQGADLDDVAALDVVIAKAESRER